MRNLALFFILLVLVLPANVLADPCSNVTRKMAKKELAAFSIPIRRHYKIESVDINQVFQIREWRIFEISWPGMEADTPFVFYSRGPVGAKYVTQWSGAAAKFEEPDILKWVLSNAPGIPKNLAICFSWHVTQDRAHQVSPE